MHAGIDPVVADSTDPSDLAAVIHIAPQLRLAFDDVDGQYPSLGIPLTEGQCIANHDDDYRPEYAASIATFRTGRLVEHAFPSADDYTPWDEYTGGDAA